MAAYSVLLLFLSGAVCLSSTTDCRLAWTNCLATSTLTSSSWRSLNFREWCASCPSLTGMSTPGIHTTPGWHSLYIPGWDWISEYESGNEWVNEWTLTIGCQTEILALKPDIEKYKQCKGCLTHCKEPHKTKLSELSQYLEYNVYILKIKILQTFTTNIVSRVWEIVLDQLERMKPSWKKYDV